MADRLRIPARDRLIVALDVPTVEEARQVVARLGDAVTFYKVGLQLLFSGGLELGNELVGQGKNVFLDAKLLDIGETVRNAVANVARLGVRFLTVHGDKRAIRAAVEGRDGDTALKILAVTVLTSLDQSDLDELHIPMTVAEWVALRARHALAAGCDGVIASGLEVAQLRQQLGAGSLIITPGVRSPGASHDDQRRVTTPAEAIQAGADYVVVGRQILRASDQRRAAMAVVEEIEAVG
ncbi:MAG: orotidine-5'-phosphate decarboxylase [Alphaproteobacteria bacterium]|nr:orotidine-5'-phosphate decarboxylase [Alphaproteobacteria bacterium]